MSNFKVGEKVVVIGCSNKLLIVPSKNEIVTISMICPQHKDSYHLEEYPKGKDGNLQSFHSDHLRKLDHQFAENLCKELAKEVQQENYQLC